MKMTMARAERLPTMYRMMNAIVISICVHYNNSQVNVSGFAWEVFGMDRESRGKAVTVTNHELCLLGHGLEYLYGFFDGNHFLK